MRSLGNARKCQICPISLSQNSAKIRKINWLWPYTNQFWRWSRYISPETQNLTCFTKSKWRQTEENQQTVTIISSALKMVKIHQHLKFQAIPSTRSPANARKSLQTDGQTDGRTCCKTITEWQMVGWPKGPMYRWKEGISGFRRTDVSQYEQSYNMMQIWMG